MHLDEVHLSTSNRKESFPYINMQLMLDCFVFLLTAFSVTHASNTKKHCAEVTYKAFAEKKLEVL